MASYERDMKSYDTDGAVAPNDLTSIQNRVEATRDLLLKIMESLDATADRAFGSPPSTISTVTGSGNVPTPMNGQIDEINRALDRLQSTAQSLVDVAARFHRL